MKYRSIAVVLALCLAGCDEIPMHNLDNIPVGIEADGTTYVTCSSYGLTNDSLLGGDSYSISFTTAGGAKIKLKGVKKLTISELPMVDAPMPYGTMPNIKKDHPANGGSYIEEATYTWADGTKAQIKDGAWVAVKVPSTACSQK
jgi:hypothetical protein